MKFKGIAFALIFISVPAVADPAARCPCFTDMQVAGTCAYASNVTFASGEYDGRVSTSVVCQNSGPTERERPNVERWLFFTAMELDGGECRTFRSVSKPSGEGLTGPGNIADENELSVAEADACAEALYSAACLLDDDNCQD